MTAATGLKPPPKFVHNQWAWEHTLAKLAEKDKLDENGNPQNYAAASAIYKSTVKKYGDMDVVPDALDFELALRSTIVELQAEDWTVSRGCAWAIDQQSTRQLWLEPRFREARHPLNPTGNKVVEPVVLWNAMVMRAEGEPLAALIESSTALWLVREAPAAEKWARSQIESAIGAIDDELTGLSSNLLEIGGIEVDTRFFDVEGTRAVMETAKRELEEVLNG